MLKMKLSHSTFLSLSSLWLWSLIVIQFLLLLHLNQAKKIVSCRNENGESVDWYYLYKLPQNHSYKKIKSNGLHYAYISSDTFKNGWKLSNLLINDTKSFPGNTLTLLIFDNDFKKNILSVAYNDENPNGKVNGIDGHTKGVIASDNNTGFWLIHSVPKYPDLDMVNNYTYPETGRIYGQSFLCITFNGTEINKIGEQLIYNEPNVYHINIPDNLKDKYSNFINVTEKKWKKFGPYWNQMNLISSNGNQFLSFAKGKNFNKELYEDWIAPSLNVNLFVETWRNGGENFHSNCSRTKHVLNVAEIKMNITTENSFESTHDHSKWCVAAATASEKNQNEKIMNNNHHDNVNNENWICVGDINRQKHQLKRGGGTVCQLNSYIAKAYRDLIENFEPCTATN